MATRSQRQTIILCKLYPKHSQSSIPFGLHSKVKMGWNYPEISLEEMVKLIKGFVDILILASGCQSSGLPAHWDAQNIKKALQWGIFFENVSIFSLFTLLIFLLLFLIFSPALVSYSCMPIISYSRHNFCLGSSVHES